ncbi:uncharacterized protein HGUI_01922 [Hanseniaspora guilliermondii]|uniref:Serine/threonine-protein phosphatase 2A activator n=1 Tax=Hanseniaspora guilliermondii TaxID=56406 RepID=A0A1L0AZZ5_9ASCO|nr:uncharacterized protein HGUI_01922 [Hanseniaspora guilliermondii]
MLEPIFSEPIKQINDSNISIKHFQLTKAYKRLLKYSHKYIKIFKTKNIHLVSKTDRDEQIELVFQKYLFDELKSVINMYPPISKDVAQQRFGNIAIRSFHDHLNNNNVIDNILTKFLIQLNNINNVDGVDEKLLCESIVEVKHYLMNAFGNRDRMDYGTGHELSFVAFLICLDILKVSEYTIHTLTFIFKQYYEFVKSVIVTYNLEPAGSHGVWGLDDNFHFSYIIGSAQMMAEPICTPKNSIACVKKDTENDNFLLWNIRFIKEVKGLRNIHEHSPVLYDILQNIKTWEKINIGLYKMWIDEVLIKFPVVQHFYFGKFFFSWKVTKKVKNDIIQRKLFQNTTSEDNKSSVLKYRMNQITVDNVINQMDDKSSSKYDRRIFPMDPPKRKPMCNK